MGVVDGLWAQLPRGAEDLVTRLVRQPQTVSAREVLRSGAFNPRDVCLSAAERSGIAAAFAKDLPAAEAAAADYEEALGRELPPAMARSECIRLGADRAGGSLRLRALGPAPIIAVRDGATYAVAASSLPTAAAARLRLQAIGCALARQLAGLFRGASALDEAEYAVIIAAAERARSGGAQR